MPEERIEEEQKLPEIETVGEESPESEEAGLGTVLRLAREECGLTHAQVFRVTRVQPYILEALENEQWDRLPSPVFVTGFIRAYARALGLDEDRVVMLYQETAPREKAPPRILTRRPHRSQKTPWLIGAAFILIIGMVYYVWFTSPPASEEEPPLLVMNTPAETESPIPGEPESPRPAPTETGPSPELSSPPSEPTQGRSGPSPAETAAAPAGAIMPAPGPPPEPGDTQTRGRRLLKAHVKERTWVKIYVDDRPPKEYIFRAGSEPEWTAERGFELIIGNAGGMDLEFDGKPMADLGAPGQVVRLRLPESYERSTARE